MWSVWWTCCRSADIKLAPWLLKISSGIPTLEKILRNSSAIWLALVLGKCYCLRIMRSRVNNIYCWYKHVLHLLLGNCPTKSMAILSNGWAISDVAANSSFPGLLWCAVLRWLNLTWLEIATTYFEDLRLVVTLQDWRWRKITDAGSW